MKEVRRNQKDVNVGIVAANNDYGGYGPGTVSMFGEMMDIEPLSYENVDMDRINHQLELENRFNWKSSQKDKQKTLTDFLKYTIQIFLKLF